MALNITDSLSKAISLALKELYGIEQSADSITLQDTRREFRGDYTLVVFPYVKQARSARSIPCAITAPPSARSSPAMIRSKVVLPAPEGAEKMITLLFMI